MRLQHSFGACKSCLNCSFVSYRIKVLQEMDACFAGFLRVTRIIPELKRTVPFFLESTEASLVTARQFMGVSVWMHYVIQWLIIHNSNTMYNGSVSIAVTVWCHTWKTISRSIRGKLFLCNLSEEYFVKIWGIVWELQFPTCDEMFFFATHVSNYNFSSDARTPELQLHSKMMRTMWLLYAIWSERYV